MHKLRIFIFFTRLVKFAGKMAFGFTLKSLAKGENYAPKNFQNKNDFNGRGWRFNERRNHLHLVRR